MKILYHATPSKNLTSILRQGLLRKHGLHKSAFISLSEKPNSWIQSGMVLLEVDIDGLGCPITTWQPKLDEVCVWGDIPPDRVKLCLDTKVMSLLKPAIEQRQTDSTNQRLGVVDIDEFLEE